MKTSRAITPKNKPQPSRSALCPKCAACFKVHICFGSCNLVMCILRSICLIGHTPPKAPTVDPSTCHDRQAIPSAAHLVQLENRGRCTWASPQVAGGSQGRGCAPVLCQWPWNPLGASIVGQSRRREPCASAGTAARLAVPRATGGDR